MADEVDVEALLEAPYRKQEVREGVVKGSGGGHNVHVVITSVCMCSRMTKQVTYAYNCKKIQLVRILAV